MPRKNICNSKDSCAKGQLRTVKRRNKREKKKVKNDYNEGKIKRRIKTWFS